MRHGKMDRRIVIKRSTIVKDAFGEATTTEAVLATVFAARIELRPGQTVAGAGDATVSAVVWRIHYRADLMPSDIVEHGYERFEVTGIAEIGRRAGIDLACERVGQNV
jgi:head-tail adaptor